MPKPKKYTLAEFYGDKLGGRVAVFEGELDEKQVIRKLNPSRHAEVTYTDIDGDKHKHYVLEFGECDDELWKEIVDEVKINGQARYGFILYSVSTHEFGADVGLSIV